MKKLSKYLLLGLCAFILGIASVGAIATNALEDILIKVNSEVNANEVVPMLKSGKQVGKNQLEITYDGEVDLEKGTKATNYWIQSLTDETPTGVATLGKNDKVSSSNSLTDKLVSIKATDKTNTTFLLTFREDIKRGAEYKLIICYITAPKGSDYTGDNGTGVFTGK